MHANYGQQQLKQLRDAGLDVGYVVPKEGALAWLDCWAITRRSTQVALAAEWINYMLDPAVSREFTRRQGLANTLDEPPALAGDAPGGAWAPSCGWSRWKTKPCAPVCGNASCRATDPTGSDRS